MFCWVCVELHLRPLTRRAGAWAGITALQFEIGVTESLVLPSVLKGMDSICATSWVDLSLLASVSFGEQLQWREHNTFPCLFLYYMVCFSQTSLCLFWARRTMLEVFGNVLLSNNVCGQVKFIFIVCSSKFDFPLLVDEETLSVSFWPMLKLYSSESFRVFSTVHQQWDVFRVASLRPPPPWNISFNELKWHFILTW